MEEKSLRRCLREVWTLRKIIFTLLSILAPVPFLLEGSAESRCAYVILVMAALWITEALPIAVTSLLPVLLFPVLGVVPATDVCTQYINDTTMLFLGGLVVAVAVEEVNLHKRVALGIILVLGTRPNMLMLGLMLPTWFLSMWISNTAAASMMLPIIMAITEQLKDISSSRSDGYEKIPDFVDEGSTMETERLNEDTEETYFFESSGRESDDDVITEAQLLKIGEGLALCVAYGATIGGVATLTGTPVNIILQGQANSLYRSQKEGADSGITFSNWMAFGLPLSVILFVLTWFWLQIYSLRKSCCMSISKNKKAKVKSALKAEYRKLGHLRELEVLCLFVILAMLWVFRDIPGFGGWRFIFKEDPTSGAYARDSTAAILIVVLLFILPSRIPRILCCRDPTAHGKGAKAEVYMPILNWNTTVNKIPWGVIILLGGGFAMADASSVSGLSTWIGCQLRVFSDLKPWVMNVILCLIVAAATELTSNSATATLLMPIMAQLAINIGVHPLYLMISTAIACSFAFMFPVATPTNAIVFSTGFVTIPAMASAGFLLNILSICVLTLAINTWGTELFGLGTFPDIFMTQANGTSTCDRGIETSTVMSSTVQWPS